MTRVVLDDDEVYQHLPTFLAVRWKATVEAVNPIQRREEVTATLELFLRTLCAVTLADYLTGERSDDAEKAIAHQKQKKDPSLGDWNRLSDALLNALRSRPSTGFCAGILDWYFGPNRKKPRSAALIPKVLGKK